MGINGKRITGSMLPQYIGQTIRFVGKVVTAKGNYLLLKSADNLEVSCTINSPIPSSKFIEVVARVRDSATIEQNGNLYSLGEDCDLDLMAKVISLSHNPTISQYYYAS
ncbi:replication factor A protein 3, putative (RPA3) [Babesia microti strain RI]|uniref:Replication factor A protein 3, putative (RPA3) n=1 Tax=Babesia microti (strain RI) TaxID=1133968 RepID=A0A1N6LXY6_BABMR|nr:replication factor A protein 3, putative (RPA3) [Babesia microti strain RI]SIO73735.1 replication factor A protein 3, putative (RPA3) [Babesia microti strain RI]|eukprot:XP_021337800.1 replication factor A protein 3, putative (RPA3) [Babesia microti strain RI]